MGKFQERQRDRWHESTSRRQMQPFNGLLQTQSTSTGSFLSFTARVSSASIKKSGEVYVNKLTLQKTSCRTLTLAYRPTPEVS